MKRANTTIQYNIRDFLRKPGYHIDVYFDHLEKKVTGRELKTGDGEVVIEVAHASIEAMLRKGVIIEKGSWTPSIHMDVTRYVLKTI